MLITIRDDEACDPQPFLLWDTIWVQRIDASGGYGDWIMAGAADQVDSRGGLRAEAALHTATLLQMFTDARASAEDRLPTDDGDRRGWWGDSVKLEGEPDAGLGSKLWLWVERGVLTEETRRGALDAVVDALATLAEQGVVARTDVEAEIDRARSGLLIKVSHFDEAGERIYDQKFGVIWTQAQRDAAMHYGDGLLVA